MVTGVEPRNEAGSVPFAHVLGDGDPHFESGYHIASNSKAIDCGKDSASPQPYDFEGDDRTIDYNNDGSDLGIVDRGADERENN